MVGREHLVRRVDPGQRPTDPLGGRRRLGAGALEQPGVQGGVDRFLGLAPLKGVGPGERRPQVVVVEDLEHLVELLRGRHHRHVAVGAGVHARRDERFAARRAQPRRDRHAAAVLEGEERGLTSGQRGQRFHRGAIDEGAVPTRSGQNHRRQPAERRHAPDEVQPEVGRQAEWVLVLAPLQQQGAADGLDDEVVPPVLRVRSGGAEAADTDDGDPGRSLPKRIPGEPPGVEPAGPCRLDDELRPRDEASETIPAGGGRRVHDGAALVGVEMEERTAAVQAIGPDRARLVAERVPRGSLHLHDIGAQVGQQLPAVAPCDPLCELHHPDPAQQLSQRDPSIRPLQPPGPESTGPTGTSARAARRDPSDAMPARSSVPLSTGGRRRCSRRPCPRAPSRWRPRPRRVSVR